MFEVYRNKISIFEIIIILIYFPVKIFSQIEIYLNFNSIGSQVLYCDDYLESFGTQFVNIYKILEDNKKININGELSLLKDNKAYFCKNKIMYSTTKENEEFYIKFDFNKITYINFEGLFRQTNINSIKIYNKNITISNFSYVFQDCIKLIYVDLSDLDFKGTKNFSRLFSGCINLENIKFPIHSYNFNKTDFSKMFSNCSSLTSINLSSFILNGENKLSNIFLNCQKLISIELKGYYQVYSLACSMPFDVKYCIKEVNEEEGPQIFRSITSLKRLNLFNMDIDFENLDLSNINSLEECLYYEYYFNIKKCSKYIGFHHCGNCINKNTQYYCTKTIESINYNFYYINSQLNLPNYNRECYWSKNFSDIEKFKFVNNGDGNISYYKYIYDFCEVYSKELSICIKCNNINGYYKIENKENSCTNILPDENYILDFEAKEWRECNKRCQKCYIQSKSEIDHQCLKCIKNFYPYKIDYDNYINNNQITGFNCFSIEEVKEK